MSLSNPQRFTAQGDDLVESQLSQACDSIHASLCDSIPPESLKGILLGGPYGRGEGAVRHRDGQCLAAGPLDICVFLAGRPRSFKQLNIHLSAEIGVPVQARSQNLLRLRRKPVSIESYDLVAQHRWIAGHEGLLSGCDHHRDPASIPLHEVTRHLLRLSSNLLLCVERLGRIPFRDADATFVRDRLQAAKLGLGDSFLAAHRQYHWSAQERHRRLLALNQPAETNTQPSETPLLPPRLDEVTDSAEISAADLIPPHSDAVARELIVDDSTPSRDVLAADFTAIATLCRRLWLWLENRRLGTRFSSPIAYATDRASKCPETSFLANGIRNLAIHGPQIPLGFKALRHPRERLLNSLPILLWEYSPNLDSSLVNILRRELRTSARNFPGWVAAYSQSLKRFG